MFLQVSVLATVLLLPLVKRQFSPYPRVPLARIFAILQNSAITLLRMRSAGMSLLMAHLVGKPQMALFILSLDATNQAPGELPLFHLPQKPMLSL